MVEVVLLRLKQRSGIVVDRDRGNFIPHSIVFATLLASVVFAGNIIHHIEWRSHFTEDRMAVVEERGRRGGDEELRAIGAGTGIGHRENPWLVVAQFGMEFIGELVAWTTASGFGRIATLEHKTIDHAVKRDVVVIPTTRQIEEIGAGDWGFRSKKSGADIAGGSVQSDRNIGHDAHP